MMLPGSPAATIRAMRIRYIEVFFAVMQCGTVKGAADMLHITQPAATRLLQQAERHAGFALFQRIKGRLVPTREARALYPDVEQLYLKLDGIRRLVDNLAHGEGGVLRVLCVPSLSQDWLPRALARVMQRHRDLRLSVRTLHSRQIVDALVLREADVGFAFEAPQHPALVAQPLTQGRLVCAGPSLGRERVTLEELAQLPVIDLDASDPLGRLLHNARTVQGIELSTRVLAHSHHTAMALAREGMGVALVDSFTGRAAQATLGLDVAVVEPEIAITVHAMQLHDAPTSAVVRHLIDSMAAVLQAPAATPLPAANARTVATAAEAPALPEDRPAARRNRKRA
nr:LysR substrate-binding domain-containing protein [uncultured Caldimonas sp.]